MPRHKIRPSIPDCALSRRRGRAQPPESFARTVRPIARPVNQTNLHSRHYGWPWRTDPHAAKDTLRNWRIISGTRIRVSTVVGRYYAMDRDKRWGKLTGLWFVCSWSRSLPPMHGDAIQASYEQERNGWIHQTLIDTGRTGQCIHRFLMVMWCFVLFYRLTVFVNWRLSWIRNPLRISDDTVGFTLRTMTKVSNRLSRWRCRPRTREISTFFFNGGYGEPDPNWVATYSRPLAQKR